jgi:plastocyanin
MRPIQSSRRRGRAAATAAVALGLIAAVLALSIVPAAADRRHRLPRRAKTVRVEIDDFAYRPPTLRIRRGTRVVFANRDRVPHTATRRGRFDTGRIRPRRSAAVRFKRRGVYRYICTIHPFMRGKIVVR